VFYDWAIIRPVCDHVVATSTGEIFPEPHWSQSDVQYVAVVVGCELRVEDRSFVRLLSCCATWVQCPLSEWVGFNVPTNTLQVISETSLSSQSPVSDASVHDYRLETRQLAVSINNLWQAMSVSSDWLERLLWGRLSVVNRLSPQSPGWRECLCVFFVLFACVTICFALALHNYFIRWWHDMAYWCWKVLLRTNHSTAIVSHTLYLHRTARAVSSTQRAKLTYWLAAK